jgi:hypothetical protein
MTSIISPFVCGTRNLLSQGFRGLPVILGGAILILGMIQGNINFLFFFVGLCVLAPTSALGLNMLWELVFSNTPSWLTVPFVLWKLPSANSEACAIYSIGSKLPPITMNVVPSYWITMISFFFTYVFMNAQNLYNMQENSKAPKAATEARKAQSMSSMILVCVVGVLAVILRYSTGCETGVGVLVSGLLGGYLASIWYGFMRGCGLGRLDDIFGISNRILPMQSYESVDPTVCVPE